MTAYPEMLGKVAACDCGAEAPIVAARWDSWIQLAPHRQPRTGLLCWPGRLCRVILLAGAQP